MFWNKKEEEKKTLPDLPPLKYPLAGVRLEESTQIQPEELGVVERNQLPSFPDSLSDRGFSQAVIKDAVGDAKDVNEASQGLPVVELSNSNAVRSIPSQYDKKFRAVEMEEWTPSRMPVAENNINEKVANDFDFKGRDVRKNVDIFVKLDKFYSARKALVDAQAKMQDIDELLRKIRETKMREEQEIVAWEKELENVKARLNNITVNLFEKVD